MTNPHVNTSPFSTSASEISSRVALELLMIQIKAMRPQEGACSMMDAYPHAPKPMESGAVKLLRQQANCGAC